MLHYHSMLTDVMLIVFHVSYSYYFVAHFAFQLHLQDSIASPSPPQQGAGSLHYRIKTVGVGGGSLRLHNEALRIGNCRSVSFSVWLWRRLKELNSASQNYSMPPAESQRGIVPKPFSYTSCCLASLCWLWFSTCLSSSPSPTSGIKTNSWFKIIFYLALQRMALE